MLWCYLKNNQLQGCSSNSSLINPPPPSYFIPYFKLRKEGCDAWRHAQAENVVDHAPAALWPVNKRPASSFPWRGPEPLSPHALLMGDKRLCLCTHHRGIACCLALSLAFSQRLQTHFIPPSHCTGIPASLSQGSLSLSLSLHHSLNPI